MLSASASSADPAGPADDRRPTATRLADARAQAEALRRQVDELEVQAALAAEDQAAATEQLQLVISDELSAEAALADAQRSGAQQRAQASRRARALYMSGGHSTMVASVLTRGSTGDLGDVLAGLRTMRTLVGADADAVGQAEQTIDDAVAGSTRLQRLRQERQRLEAEQAKAAEQLRTTLDQQQALLAEADADVVALADQQRREEEEAELAAAREAAARRSALLATTQSGGVVSLDLSGPVEAPTAAAARAIEAALAMRGTPYQWGATGPGTFDCSGLTMWAYRQAGVAIPRTSRSQYAGLPAVPLERLQPGDLVFYAAGSSPSSIHHVGIYLGGGQMVHAPRTGDVVKVSALWPRELYGAVRPTG